MSSFDQAIAQMRALGMPDFPPGHPKVGVGRITRYGPKKKAWYRLEAVRTRAGREVIVGAFGVWGQLDSTKIEVDWQGISREERAELETRTREAEERERQKREERAGNAANRAREQWKAALAIEAAAAKGVSSAYLARKQVKPEGCRFFTDGTVLVPMHVLEDGGARLVGLQKIAPDGLKRFNKGMAAEAALARLGDAPEDGHAILVCEGYATGLSIREATERMLAVFVAFNAGNLAPVARTLRARYPSSPIVFCADDDWQTTRPDGAPWNPGIESAHKAARAVGHAWVICPLFMTATREAKWTDFNDVHVAYGLPAVKMQLDLSKLMQELPAIEREGEEGTIRDEARVSIDSSAEGSDTPPQPDGAIENHQSQPRTWRERLQRTDKGRLKPTVHNIFLILGNDPRWEGVLGYDTFAEAVVKLKPPPFADGAEAGEWNDMDDHRLVLWLSEFIGEPHTEAIQRGVQLAAHLREFNPLGERLRNLCASWDGVPRLRTWLRDYLGACTGPEFDRLPQSERDRLLRYAELVGVKWPIAAIARVFEPGCRVDNMLIFEGGQGAFKSTALSVLAGGWFTDATLNFENKDSFLILQGRWIIEMAELEGMNKAEASSTKKFLSQREDLFRPPYGRRLIKCPRRCVFAGSVNHYAYLKDDSGNRRFWPVRAGEIRIDELRRDVDQLWGEAMRMYEEKTPWWVQPEERHLFEEQQEARYDVDVWESLVLDYTNGTGAFQNSLGGRNWKRTVKLHEIMQNGLKLDPARMDRQAKVRVAGILRRHGWTERRESAGSRQRFFERPAAEPETEPAAIAIPAQQPIAADDEPF